jgi:hypothetical protein
MGCIYLSDVGGQDGYPGLGWVVAIQELSVFCRVLVYGGLQDDASRIPNRELLGLALATYLVEFEGPILELDYHRGPEGVSGSCATLH